MSESKAKEKAKVKQVSAKLMARILPVIALGVALIIAVVAIFGMRLVKELLYTSLEQHVAADAGEVNKQLNASFYYLNAIADSLETQKFEDTDEMTAFTAQTVERYATMPTGVYVALSDGTYIDPTGWDPGKDIRETNWYKQGIAYDNSYYYFYDVPYFDASTGDLCATVVRHIHPKGMADGVIASDLMMKSSQEYLNGISIYGTGHAIMITGQGMILSAPNTEWCGQNIADVGDTLYANMTSVLTAEDGVVMKIKGKDGSYYAVGSTVNGTDWKVINYAKASDVLSSVYTMFIAIIVVAALLMLLMVVLFVSTLGRMIRKPVAALTDNIKSISEGDFTVEIEAKGNDEIAFMNSSMNGFIQNIRGTIRNIQEVSQRLEVESRKSKDTAVVLNGEAQEQSNSMVMILDNMEAMSNSVTEVAENATSLAQTVADLTDAEQQVETNMNELVGKAEAGQRDMSKVSDGMDDIVASMNDMNNAVRAVDDAAVQINQIIDMINDIASQTNLLSLNASIEAARAGEAGRGFAVVATEIGQLANNSADATHQIADIIQGMTAKVRDLAEKSEANTKMINDSSEAITNAATTFQQITEDLSNASKTLSQMAQQMGTVNDVASNMASVSEEQSATSMEITNTINQLTESSRNVAESSGTVENAATSVAEAVDQINESVRFFTIDTAQKVQEIIEEEPEA